MSKKGRGKGFGQQDRRSPKEPNGIYVSSIVKSRDGEPAVHVMWGELQWQATPDQARAHAFGILEACASAEMDACVVKWATEKLGLTRKEAVQILAHFRQRRETGQTPSVTLNLGDEHIRPETARSRAYYLLANAFNAEMEAFLAALLLELDQPPDRVGAIVQEFREMRGLQTDWPTQEDGGDRNG
ncbi:MAG TPA: hypothetical protein V6D07_18820 [Trichocoleus sp.]